MDKIDNELNKIYAILDSIGIGIASIEKHIIPEHCDNLMSQVFLKSHIENALSDINISQEIRSEIIHKILKFESSQIDYSILDSVDKAFKNLHLLIESKFDYIAEWHKNYSERLYSELKRLEESEQKYAEKYRLIIDNFAFLSGRSTAKILYNNNYERKVIEDFRDIQNQSWFKEKFLKLIEGLSSKDTEIIIKILLRQQKILNSKENENLDIYTDEEKVSIKKIQDNFKPMIFRITSDLYCYKKYLLPINHFEPSVFWDKHGLECLENSEYFAHKDIIDAGGFIGDSILIFSPLTDKKVYSFEASQENYDLLLQTIELNKINNAVAEHVALLDKKSNANFNVCGSGSSCVDRVGIDKKKNELVQTETLDNYVRNNKLEVGLIKIDVEGSEQAFLRGAKNTIEKYKPTLLISIYHNVSDFFDIKPMIESWDLGYYFTIHKAVDFTISREVLLICEIKNK
jgi:FkbM family methyltransferase